VTNYSKDDYRADALAVLTTLYEVCNETHTMMSKIDEVNSSEWQMLYGVARNASIAADQIHRSLYPMKSVFRADTADTKYAPPWTDASH
jgi:hypothetical protein